MTRTSSQFMVRMHGLVCAAMALCIPSVAAYPQTTDAALEQIINDDLQTQAQAAMEIGERQQAVGLLDELVSRDPRHAGALLDVALLYCQLGKRDLMQQTLARIERQFTVPAPIQKLIVFYRTNPCIPAVAKAGVTASIGIGVTSNANFGPTNPLVTFAPGAPVNALMLSPESLAHGDEYVESAIQGALPIAALPNVSLLGGLASRQYRREHAYDQRVATFGVAHQTTLGRGEIGNQLTANMLWLGTQLYQRDIEWHASYWSPTSELSGVIARAGLDLTVDGTVYPGNALYNSLRIEPKAAFNARIGNHATVLFLIGPLWDSPHNDRPGGGRRGYTTYVELDYDRQNRGRLEAIYQQRTLTDTSPYDTMFFGDIAREQTLRSASLRYVYPLSHSWSAYAQLSAQRVADSISIFSYTVRSASMGLSWKY